MKRIEIFFLRMFSRFYNQYFASSELSNRLALGGVAMNSSRSNRADFKNLWDAEVKVFSQFGEDGILNYLFDVFDIAKPRIVEFGAGNFTECNSRFAAEYRNASVYPVDLRHDLIQNVESLEVYWKNHIFPQQDFITPESAIKHLKIAEQLMNGVDMISLDIDGNDYWVLQKLNLNNIKILVCEYNPLYGPYRACTVPKDDNYDRTMKHFSWLHFGMSLRAAIGLATDQGLVFAGTNRVGNNAFFVRGSLANKLDFSLPDTSDLSQFTDWRVREARDSNGELNYSSGSDRIKSMADCEVFDIEKNALIKVGTLWNC